MGEQVGDEEGRLVIVLSDPDLDGLSVRCVDDTSDGERDGGPLVLLDAAVVVRLEERHVRILEQRVRLEVEPGAVDVGYGDAHTLGDGLLALGAHHDRLAAVDLVELGSRLVLGAADVFGVAVLGQDGEHVVDDLALGLVGEELLVALAEFFRLPQDLVVLLGEALGLGEDLVGQRLALSLLNHAAKSVCTRTLRFPSYAHGIRSHPMSLSRSLMMSCMGMAAMRSSSTVS